jgi:hypothetical protein
MATHLRERVILLSAVAALMASAAMADSFMGEYTGTFYADSRTQMPATAKVVAESPQDWRIAIDGVSAEPDRQSAHIEVYGNLQGQGVDISYPSGGYRWHGGVQGGHLSVASEYGQHFELDKIVRKSPNEGLEPPAGAVVLLPYKKGVKPDMGAWTNQNWEPLDNGALRVRQGSSTTKERFGDIKQLHVEFWLPLEPGNRGQGRANSGVFLNDTYEVQVLDSFGLVETSGDCGSLYSVKRPDVNASLPPETWQTYDIEFRAPRLNADGSIKEGPRITVIHNGVKIHDNVEIRRGTADPKAEQRTTGPIQIQDHSHPIQYRNIWLVKGE